MSRTTDRRRFLARAAGGVSALLLAGCDRLSQSQGFVRVLESAEELNRRIHRMITPRAAMAKEYGEADISPQFPSNGTRPRDPEYLAHALSGFASWRIEVGGLVERPLQFSLPALRELASRSQITRHDCVEGWSAIAKWKGARLSALLEAVRPLPEARFLVFHCADTMQDDGARYYEGIDFDDAFHPQTILAYEWNDRPLPVEYGAPVRLRVERQLGYKMAKYVRGIELVASFAHIQGGRGGYWEDRGYEWYAGI